MVHSIDGNNHIRKRKSHGNCTLVIIKPASGPDAELEVKGRRKEKDGYENDKHS